MSDTKQRVELVGADGNAFNIIGLCMRVARKANWTEDRIKAVREEMTCCGYDNVIATAMKYFDVR